MLPLSQISCLFIVFWCFERVKKDGVCMPKSGDYVYRRKNGSWEARYVKEISPDGKKKYGSVYAKTCKEAKEKRQAKQEYYLLNPPPLVCVSKLTIDHLAQEWLFINQMRLKPSTYQKYEGFCKKHIIPLLGTQRAAYLTTAQIQAFAMNRSASGLKASTVNSILTFLHTLFKYAQRQYKLIMPEIVYLSYEYKEMRVLSITEQKVLVSYLTKDMDIFKLGILLALYTGLRIGELCALHWSNIRDGCIYVQKTMQRLKYKDKKGTYLYVGPPKTKKSIRVIPIPSFMMSFVESFRRDDEEYFLATEENPVVEPRLMQLRFKRCIKEAGIETATFHTLRHTFSTRCIEASVDIKTLSELLGHANVRITLNRYVHSSLDLKRSSIEKLAHFL